MKGEAAMDNPVSWAILVILVIFFAIWFVRKCEEEIEKNKAESAKYFWEVETGQRGR